jgi:hypothetical protein
MAAQKYLFSGLSILKAVYEFQPTPFVIDNFLASGVTE